MPIIDTALMQAQASLEHQLGEARNSLRETRVDLAIFNLPKADQDLTWPEGPPASWTTLTHRARRLERQIESLELALTGADQLAARRRPAPLPWSPAPAARVRA